MPAYTYRCGECGREFDVFVLRRGGEVKCPHCGSKEGHERIFKPFSLGKGARGCSGGSGGSCATKGFT